MAKQKKSTAPAVEPPSTALITRKKPTPEEIQRLREEHYAHSNAVIAQKLDLTDLDDEERLLQSVKAARRKSDRLKAHPPSCFVLEDKEKRKRLMELCRAFVEKADSSNLDLLYNMLAWWEYHFPSFNHKREILLADAAYCAMQRLNSNVDEAFIRQRRGHGFVSPHWVKVLRAAEGKEENS